MTVQTPCLHMWKFDLITLTLKCEKCGTTQDLRSLNITIKKTDPDEHEETPQEAYDRAMRGV